MHNSLPSIMDLQVVYDREVLFNLWTSYFSIHFVPLMSTQSLVPKPGFKIPLWSRSYKRFTNSSNQQTYTKHSVLATTKVLVENKPYLL